MKKIIILTLVTYFLNSNLYAQDILIKKSGEEVPSVVLEVTLSEVKYRKFENLNGPIYTILIKDLKSITYKNGNIDNFFDEKVPPIDSSKNIINKNDSVKNYKIRDGTGFNISIGYSNIVTSGRDPGLNGQYPVITQDAFNLGMGSVIKLNDRVNLFISNSLIIGSKSLISETNLYKNIVVDDIASGLIFKLFKEKPKDLFFMPDFFTVGPSYQFFLHNSGGYYRAGSNYFKGYSDFQSNTIGYNLGLRYKFPLKDVNLYAAFSYTNQPIANSSYSYEFKNFTIFFEKKRVAKKNKKNRAYLRLSESPKSPNNLKNSRNS